PQRKLSANGRIFGTMQLALDHEIEPVNMAKGAAAGILYLLEDIKGEGAEEGSCIGVGKKVDSAQLRKLLQQYSNGWDKDFHERLLNLTSDCFMLH
ncbi:MAG: hypothetical protein KAR47_00350, partial [Planctomycetes bacterium]|nr:hypothetical protein [Planctomycetota bacterium]